MQVGGTIGTAVLGAVMSAKVGSGLAERWNAAHLPMPDPEQLAAIKSATAVGVVPVAPGTLAGTVAIR